MEDEEAVEAEEVETEETDVETDTELIIGDDSEIEDETEETEEEEEETSLEDVTKEYESLKTNYESLSKHKGDLDKALHGLRQEIKTLKTGKTEADGEDAEFTDSQLLGLMETHKDDPATMLQIMRHEAKQAAKNQGKAVVDDLQTGNLKKQTDDFLLQQYPNFYSDDSEIRPVINSAKEKFGLDDHPLGDFFAAGSVALQSLPQIMQAQYERGKKEALGGKAEETRKENIGKKTPADSGKRSSKSTSLKGQALETAQQMGLSPSQQKLYAKMLGNKNKSVSVEA